MTVLHFPVLHWDRIQAVQLVLLPPAVIAELPCIPARVHRLVEAHQTQVVPPHLAKRLGHVLTLIAPTAVVERRMCAMAVLRQSIASITTYECIPL